MLVNLSRSTYYEMNKQKDVKQNTTGTPVDRIEELVEQFPRYGYRRITKHLRREGTTINHKKVLKIMRDNNWLCRPKKGFVSTTDSNHELPVYTNKLKDLLIYGADQVWVSDITYVRVQNLFVYLAVVMDAYTRKIVGWALSENIDSNLTRVALATAITNQKPQKGWVHHSDRGKQYAARAYVELVESSGGIMSMAAKGNPYENPQAESLMKTIKWEEVNLNEYVSLTDAYESIARFIDRYNNIRLHSAIGYLPPVEFEVLSLAKSVQA